MALPLFAITLFVSAFLLFLVQPLIGKLILPRLGGTPQVWNTCMLFFQTTLLLGYFYTHATSKLTLRRQMILHCGLLIVPLLFLLPNGPFNIEGWIPPPGANPILSTLALLAFIVGVPFLVVSTSAPLLQKWFSHTGHPAAKDPYFLYGASNLGSLLSLVLYPFAVEPMMILHTQAWVWTVSYVILAIMIVACAVLVMKSGHLSLKLAPAAEMAAAVHEEAHAPVAAAQTVTAVKAGPAPSAARSTAIQRKKGFKKPGKPAGPTVAHAPIVRPESFLPRTDKVTALRRLRWILLAFAPSSLMLGVTSYVSVDLSPFPLLWVIPLALYLLSFILVFSKVPIPWVGTPHTVAVWGAVPAILAMCFILLRGGFDPFVATWISFIGFFLVALVCHGELAKDRPTPAHLTEYFLLMSVGGALGGFFNGIIAPLLFVGVAEYPIAIAVACFLRPTPKPDGWLDETLVNAFPSLETWSRDTGDKMAQGVGMAPPRSHWVLNVMLDVFIGLFVLGLTLWIRNSAQNNWNWYNDNPGEPNGLVSVLKTLGFRFDAERPGEYSDKLRKFLPIGLYGPSLIVCALVGFGRALRFGFCVTGLLLAAQYFTGQNRDVIYSTRSYFGVLKVYLEPPELLSDPEIPNISKLTKNRTRDSAVGLYTHLMHGTTDHGKNYHEPKELRRLATTYYHRKGPVGKIMERWNWGSHPEIPPELNTYKQNTFYADARLPVSMIGLAAPPLGSACLPVDQITACWSEPPYATIGLGTGTMASYARWLQHVTFYEIDENIRNFSLPPNEKFLMDGKDPYFTYLADAIRRGANVEVVMGDARQSMAQERPEATAMYALPELGTPMPSAETPLYSKHTYTNPNLAKREKYYKVIEVDAFSSDAIPIHLTTLEGIKLYFDKAADDGVVCMHTSNRHMDLVKPVTDIAHALGKKWRIGHDVGAQRAPYLGHYGSEYVMLANHEKLPLGNGKEMDLLPPEGTTPLGGGVEQQWKTNSYGYPPYHVPPGMRLWTDDFSNIVSILR